MIIKFVRLTTFFIIISVIFIFCTNVSSADMGPKDELIIRVKNPCKELYYLDLLTQSAGENSNLNDDETESYNRNMLSMLYSYEAEGWLPALINGTDLPLWGNLIGTPDGDLMIHSFGYYGLPKKCRIIIVTESGKVTVSDEYTRESLYSDIVFDYNTAKIESSNLFWAYFMQFLSTFIPTIIIEGLILLLFRFELDLNLKTFLIVNIITQLFLTFTLGTTMIREGPISAYFVQVPAELVVLIAEVILYRLFLKGKSNIRRIVYGITANLASWLMGFLFMFVQYEYIKSFS